MACDMREESCDRADSPPAHMWRAPSSSPSTLPDSAFFAAKFKYLFFIYYTIIE